MKDMLVLLAGGAIGAGVAYLLDAKAGRERRLMIRDRAEEATGQLRHHAEAGAREIKTRAGELRETADEVGARMR